MTVIYENIAGALRTLRENLLRTVLTMLGIVIGVGSVVLLVAIGEGVKAEISRQIESIGANVVFVIPGKLDRSGQPNPMSMIGISTLTERDVADLARVPGVTHAVPIMFVYGSVERGREVYPAMVIATTHEIRSVRPRPFVEGRFFGPDESDARVSVLSGGPKTQMFGDRRAVGETILVREVPFTVVGVLQEDEESLFGPGAFSNMVYVPIQAARSAFQGGQINRILLETDYSRPSEPVLEEVRRVLLRNHGGREDFGVITQTQLLRAVFRIFNLVTALLVGISAISLFVAGIGIMNIMLVTVTERTREIGIRKAVGARRRDIFVQFLTEALVLSLMGGTVGTLAAAAVCAALARYSPLHPIITGQAVGLALSVCLSVGLVFGVAPAMRAARKDPVEALRWE